MFLSIATFVTRRHRHPLADSASGDMLAQSRGDGIAVCFKHEFAIWRSFVANPLFVRPSHQIGSPPRASVRVTLNKRHSCTRDCECTHPTAARLIMVKRALVPILHFWVVAVGGEAESPNSRTVQPPDFEALTHDCLGDLILAVGFPHAQSVIPLPARPPFGC